MEQADRFIGRIANPLDNYRSYSTHFVMFACRSTEVAKEFSTSAARDFDAAVNNVRGLGEPVLYKNATDVFLMLDTRRFSQFSVESLRYDVFINGLQKGASTSNLATDLTMVVLDAVGISFADFLQYLMDKKLKTSYDGLVFMLQTIFVGHKDDGTSETVHSETIPMHLIRIEINLNFVKGAYTMQFMPNMNFDVKKYQRFMTIGQTTSMYDANGGTLGNLIASFQDNLNTRAEKYYNGIKAFLDKTTAKKDKIGRKVQYQISIPEKWKGWKTTGKNVADTTEAAKKSKDPKAPPTINVQINSGNFTTKPGTGITEALTELFKTVNEIAALGNFTQSDPSKDGSVTFYKQIVGITSNDETFMVHVDVIEFEIPNVFRRKPNPKEVSKSDEKTHHIEKDADGVERRVPNDYIVYDYIFSGKNKDILNLELKIEEFQMLLASNLKIGTIDMQKASTDGEVDAENQKLVEEILSAREYDPIMIPNDTDDALKAFTSLAKVASEKQAEEQKKRQNYTRNLSMFYAGSPIVTTMLIKGNPEIMHKFNVGKILNHPADPNSGDYRKQLEKEILKNDILEKGDNGGFKVKNFSPKSYAVSPVFVKVNIFGPEFNELWGQTKSALSEVYYVVFKLSNIIQNGVFTQELELYSHNVFGPSNLGETKTT